MASDDQSCSSRESVDLSSLNIWGSARSSSASTIGSTCPTEYSTYVFKDGFDLTSAMFSPRSLSLNSSPGHFRKEEEGEEENHDEFDEEAQKWVAIERVPTFTRLRTAVLQATLDRSELDVTMLDNSPLEGQQFVDQLLRDDPDDDNERFLQKLRNRIDRVGIQVPTIEIRYECVTVDAKCIVGDRALPTLTNVATNTLVGLLSKLGLSPTRKTNLNILHSVSGIVKPGRMTLLLGPPSSGKTTLLLALATKLSMDLKVKGKVTYNGHNLDEFVPQRTAAYVSQHDLHVPDMTVRETLDFSARCQGVGTRHEMLLELAKREKEAGIIPDGDVDAYMKATAKGGMSSIISTNYIMKILGLDACSDVIVGDMMQRGISGGQKKRVTTGEIIVGPPKALLMDEISTGLDSSTTHRIVKCLSHFCHILEDTIMISLLQPDPETFNLFDDVVLISEGRTVYSGPREHILEFFESCGFKCPERKGVADFLQEVTSRKDQAQYWSNVGDAYPCKPHCFVSVKQFAEMFKRFHVGVNLAQELATPYPKEQSHMAALTVDRYGVSNLELFKANFAKEYLLKKRQSFVFVFRAVLISIMALVAMTTFFRTTMGHTTEAEGEHYLGALFFGVVAITFSGYAEIAMTIFRLPVFFKQRDLLFYPAWTYTLPSMVLAIPSSIMEAAIFTAITYFGMGFAPEPSRFFKHFLLLVMAHINATSMFRSIAGLSRTMVVASTGGSCALMVTVMLSGFIIPRQKIKPWWIWGYWSSPMGYAVRATAVNEFLAPRWATAVENSSLALGRKVLHNFGIQQEAYWYWVGIAVIFGFTVLFNVVYALSLTHLNPLGKPQAVISKAALAEKKNGEDDSSTGDHQDIVVTTTRVMAPRKLQARSTTVTPNPYANGDSRRGGGGEDQNVDECVVRTSHHGGEGESTGSNTKALGYMMGMVMPFKPLTITFHNIKYFVPGMRAGDERLQLLNGVTGMFRPGILTALVGVSGAGKTTLMDVLAGRKTEGDVEGEIRISGFPKVQETFARVSGYCEQNDIHSPQVTVRESLIFSAWLRLPSETHRTRLAFVEEVMELVELKPLQHALVGLPGASGLSTEQRKRFTIAVELVANPSIIFMDEPTSGLDARAAAIVMRTIRNTVNTGRTVVCTIHQPSIDIFESFDEMLLMKRGGRVVYMGPLGRNSQLLIDYLESIRGVPKIKEGYNPAMWMLEATSATVEAELNIDFADHYAQSSRCMRNNQLVKLLSIPESGAKDLHFPTQFSQPFWIQIMACLWKQHWTYWCSADYNCVRFLFTFLSALVFGTMYWGTGNNITDQTSLFSVLGAMYASMLFLGVNNSSTVQPVVSIERTIFYREKAAGMYSAVSYATAQVLIEIPYCLAQSLLYAIITYSMMSLHWTAVKFSYYFFLLFCTLLYFTYYGMMAVAVTPNCEFAAILASAFYSIFNLFSGFIIFRPNIPIWWVWYYWACPVAWTVQGLVITQFGDVTSLMETTDGRLVTVKAFVETTFGMSTDMLRPAVAMPAMFVMLFAGVFVTGIKCFNFQRR